ncbi:MAG: hypothetical protein ABI446_09735 [Gemmatimonadaceae bacterium]
MARSKSGSGPRLKLDTSASASSAGKSSGHSDSATWHLASDDLEELREAIERSLCEGEQHDSRENVIDDDLRKSLRIACAKARLQRIHAEHVLMDVKQIWISIPRALATKTSARLAEIVTACINEYYEKSDTSVT